MLRNTLKSLVEDTELLTAPFYEKRPEQLSVAEFVQMTKNLENHIKQYNEPRDQDNG